MLRVRMMLIHRQLEAMKERLLAHPVMLTVGAAVLVTAHVIYFILLHRAGVPLAVVSGLAVLIIAKHLGLLGPLYGLLRRSRISGARPTEHTRQSIVEVQQTGRNSSHEQDAPHH